MERRSQGKIFFLGRGAIVYFIGAFLLAAPLVNGGGRSAYEPSAAFTLAIWEHVAGGDNPLGESFTLAKTSPEPAGIFLGLGLGIIEDPINYNTAIGVGALANNSGARNTASGYWALRNNTTGGQNTAVGCNALLGNTTGSYNTATGAHALGSPALNASFNTANGASALNSNRNGDYNTAIGAGTMWYNSDGQRNTAVGRDALYFNQLGNSNTAVGYQALRWSGLLLQGGSNNVGHFNTALGHNAGIHIATGSWNIDLGAVLNDINNMPVSLDESNTTRIGSAYDPATSPPSGQNRAFIAGIVESPLTSDLNPAVVGITSEGRLGTFPAALLPKGDAGPQGPQGPAGAGFISGSVLFLLPSAHPPAGFVLFGTTEFMVRQASDGKNSKTTVNVYIKQ